MRDLGRLAVANHDVGLAVEDWLYKFGDIGSGVLVVAICVDNDVGTGMQAGIHPAAERPCEAHVDLVPDDVMHPELPGDLNGPVGTAIVDDQQLDLADPIDLLWNVCHRLWQGLLFVVAGDLYDELHLSSIQRVFRRFWQIEKIRLSLWPVAVFQSGLYSDTGRGGPLALT